MPIERTDTDEDLLGRARSGDEEAFMALYSRRQAGIFRFAHRMTGSRNLAEDVTQEVFLALLKPSLAYQQDGGSLASYLYGIARKQLLRRLSRERNYVSLPGQGSPADGWNGETPDPRCDPHRDAVRGQSIEQVRQAVLSLPVRYREVVVLCALQEMSYTEAGAVLSCPEGTVRSRLHRARSLLVGKLKRAEQPACRVERRRERYVV